MPNCVRVCNYDHIHRGKTGERQPTAVSIAECANNAQREQVFNLLTDKELKDWKEGKIMRKRAQTAMQRDRNTYLFKTCDEIKKRNSEAKINFLTRGMALSGNIPAHAQDKDGLGRQFSCLILTNRERAPLLQRSFWFCGRCPSLGSRAANLSKIVLIYYL